MDAHRASQEIFKASDPEVTFVDCNGISRQYSMSQLFGRRKDEKKKGTLEFKKK
jgi:hypothetical protein